MKNIAIATRIARRILTPGRIIAGLSALSISSFFLYGAFFAMTMRYATESETTRDMIAEASAEVSDGEVRYIELQRSLTPARAAELGFVEAGSKAFVSRQGTFSLRTE
jgi:hypothetical protein